MPRTDDLLEHFSPRKTRAEEGQTHYPYGIRVAATNVFTGQVVRGIVDDYRASERALLKAMIVGGIQVYLEFERHGQFFIHRAKTTGDRVAKYIQRFLDSGKKQKTIVFVTNLLDRKRYPRHEILSMYRKRWSSGTLYARVKNLLILSLTAIAVTAVVDQDQVDVEVELPGFKNASESIRRHLFSVIDHRIEGIKPKELVKQILVEVRSIMYPIRPGRSYPRVSMQPIKSWNLKKSAKLKQFAKQKKASGALRSKAEDTLSP